MKKQVLAAAVMIMASMIPTTFKIGSLDFFSATSVKRCIFGFSIQEP